MANTPNTPIVTLPTVVVTATPKRARTISPTNVSAIPANFVPKPIQVQTQPVPLSKSAKRYQRSEEIKAQIKLNVDYPYPISPLGTFLQLATTKAIAVSKDIRKNLVKATDKVEIVNEIDLCNLVSYFLSQAIPSGSNVEKQFQKLKEESSKILQQIKDSEDQIINKPILRSSIPTSQQTFATNVNNSTPSPTNTAAQNPNYGAGASGFGTAPQGTNTQTATGGNNGTSVNAQPGNPVTIDSTLESIRKVKALVGAINIPEPILKIIPGGNKVLDSLKRINEQIPTNMSSFPNQDIQKIFSTYEEIKTLLSGISNAENPADLLSVFKAQNAISKLQDKLNPAQLIPVINEIVRAVETIGRVINTISVNLNKINTVIRTLNTILTVISAIAKFIRNLPLPARWATVGVILKLQKVAETLENKVGQAKESVAQAAYFISTYTQAIAGINRRLQVLIGELKILQDKLEKCKKTSNLPATKKLKEVILTIENNINNLNAQLPAPLARKKQVIYKGFTLDIIEEQAADENIVALRRYGVALDKRGVVVVQTELTYATNIELIQNELRLLIDKNNLNADPVADNTISEEDTVYAELGLPSEEEQAAELAATQAEIDALVKQIAPEENLRKERSKRDKRKLKRLARAIRRLRDNGKGKAEIKKRLLKKNKFDQFDDQDFEEAWKASFSKSAIKDIKRS